MNEVSMKFKESGTLPVGVEVDGKFHHEFTLRPRLVRDSVDVLEEDSRAQSNDAYRGVALIARQIEQLGDLEPDQITAKLLLSMFDTDLAAIMAANSRLEERLKNFRAEGKNAPASASGIGENRDTVA
jgi:phage FluMu protein gp41